MKYNCENNSQVIGSKLFDDYVLECLIYYDYLCWNVLDNLRGLWYGENILFYLYCSLLSKL